MMTRLLVVWFLGLASAWGALEWDRLSDLPDREGFAGVFSGKVSAGDEEFLVVAGGANFPSGRPWEGGKKVYYDDVFVLPLKDGGEWRRSEAKLPKKIGYGMSVSLADGRCWFMGGKNDAGCVSEILVVKMVGGGLEIQEGRSLPVVIAEGVSGVIGDEVFVGAGANGERVGRMMYRLDASSNQADWDQVGWPEGARGRMYAVSGVKGSKFYLFGGRDLAEGEEEKENRISGLDWLKDCWELNVETGNWKRLADMPEARSAAPSMAMPVGVFDARRSAGSFFARASGGAA